MSNGNKTMRLPPGEMRDVAGALGRLSGDADEVRRQLSHSWHRLDGGWEWYAAVENLILKSGRDCRLSESDQGIF